MLDDTISSGSFGSDLQRIDASIVEKLEMLSTAQSREAQLSDGAAALRMSRASMDAQLSEAKAVGASIAAEQQAEHKRFLILEDEFGHTSQQLQFLCWEKARLKASQRDFQSSNQKVKAQMQSTCAQIELHFDLDPHWGGRLQERKRGLDSLQESAMEHATFEAGELSELSRVKEDAALSADSCKDLDRELSELAQQLQSLSVSIATAERKRLLAMTRADAEASALFKAKESLDQLEHVTSTNAKSVRTLETVVQSSNFISTNRKRS